MVEVYAIRIIEDEDFLKLKDRLILQLPVTSQKKIRRYKRASSMQRSLIGELITRQVLSRKMSIPSDRIEIKKSEKGKPFVAPTHGATPSIGTHRATSSHPVSKRHPVSFNISHSGAWVVVAFADKEVGIDVEKIRQIKYNIAERFFSKDEYSELVKKEGKAKLHFFFDLWTLKESYLKLLGKGLTKSLSSFSIIKSNSEFRLKEDKTKISSVFFKQYFLDNDYKLSVCSLSQDFDDKLKILSVSDIL